MGGLKRNNFLFVASENDALKNCKVGGVGDVIRDVPRDISKRGDRVHVVVPSYSRLHHQGELVTNLNFHLRGVTYVAYLYKVVPKEEYPELYHYVIHHPEIESGNIGNIYHNDPTEPFFTDTIKYMIFCTAVAEAIRQGEFGKLDIVHLHDWHTGLLLFLKNYHPAYLKLQEIRFIYCIHNLAIQGIRPFSDSYSSLETFFPDLEYDREDLRDPRYEDCFNLMAMGIRFADAVHTVSPSYKEDVLLPSAPPEFIGGEGLENDLKKADSDGRFYGILNGSDYPKGDAVKRNALFGNIVSTVIEELRHESRKYKIDFLGHTGQKALSYVKRRPGFICASVARLTEQKFYFFKQSPEAFLSILDKLEEINGVYVLLGTGAPEYEQFLRSISYQKKNFIFINAQSEVVVNAIYQESDLYLMPSLFEPCGISQMLAMRNGQPCLVHSTGGLKDTVKHIRTGFSFGGRTYEEKVKNMVAGFEEVIEIYQHDKETWKRIRKNAKKMRFTWKKSVDDYYKLLYTKKQQDWKIA